MRLGPIFLIFALAACDRGDAGRTEAPTTTAEADTARPWRKPGDKIDSILPMSEYLRRFRQGLAEPARLTGGAESRDDLARRFLAAVSSQDSTAFADLAVSRAEFAYLVFPHHLYHDQPYELDPEIFWMQLTAGSANGLHRTLERYGGTELALVSLGCERDTLQAASGLLKVWSNCTMRYRVGDRGEARRMFGSIVERDGRLKLLSFANDF